MKHFVVIFTVVLGAALASAQTAIPIGAGSYASFPPASAGGTAIATANQSLYVVSNNVPIPSNKWWTDLVINQYAGNLWASPLAVSANAQGINISRPNFDTVYDGAHSFLGVNFQPDAPLSIQGQGFSPADARALNWGDWTVTFRMQQASQFMDVTIGHGLPYTWIQFTGVSPQIVLPMAATYFDDSGNAVSFPVTTNHFGLSYSNKIYGIFAPDNTQFTLSGNTINVTFAGASTYLVIGVMPSKTNLAYFSQYAYAVPSNSAMNWVYDPNAGTVTTSWHLATQPWKGAETNTIQGWIPHHWRNTNNFVFNGIQYWVARGLMKCTTGTDFQIVYKFNGIPPTLPAPTQLGLPNDYDPSRMDFYISSVASNTAVAGDTYAGGKDMLRYAQHMVFAGLMGRPEFSTLENTLRTTLTDWYTYSTTSDGRYFAFYPAWKALTGFPAGYGSDQFNDHHFHYGYFTHATALLGMYDQNFLNNYGPMATLVAKEYANWDRSDTNFPFLRTFDIWEGHSWASGFSDPAKGNNQESSAEAMNSWGGLFLLGSMLVNNQMRDAGAMGYAMESEGVRQYYFNVPKFYNSNDGNWPSNYTSSIVGILWGSGQEAQTYFGGSPVYVHGIQWLPPSPIMQYQVEDPAFAQRDFNNMMTEYGGSISSMGSEWGNYALGYAAQFNPGYAATQLGQLWAANDPVATDVTYAGATYYQTYALRMLGPRQWQFHISVPTSAVYYNTNSGQYTYVAYNPQSTSQMATVYSNNIAIGTMVLPAYSLVSQPAVGNGTIVTNVVPSSASAGVEINWPTIVNTNYAVQWTASLGANAAWTNLTIPTVGNGTTNSVFDPFSSYPQKFYRVFQSP
jgi:endoglucanase Acf2